MKIMMMTVIFLLNEYFDPLIFCDGNYQQFSKIAKLQSEKCFAITIHLKSNSGKVLIGCLVKFQFNLYFVTTGCSYIISAKFVGFPDPSPPLQLKNLEC